LTVKLQSAKQLTGARGVKMLVYGKAGVGKTVLCATAPAPIILSAEAGLLSLRKVITETGKDMPVAIINNMKDLYEVYEWLKSSNEAKQFKTICLDSITEIAEVVLSKEKAVGKRDARLAYGGMIDQVNDLLRSFRDLSKQHVYFSCKLETIRAEGGEIYYQPMMPGQKLGMQLPYIFDEVFAYIIGTSPTGEKYRALRTAPDIYYEAKDRSGMLDELEYPDLSNIIRKIEG
jgi:hypothetical protein